MERPYPHVVGLLGSLRPESTTRRALEVALKGAADHGASTALLDLRAFDLPLCVGLDPGYEYPERVDRLRKLVQDADGIILATPEYHGSYSGVLKNALDLMGFAEFELKMVGLVSVAGSPMGGIESLTGLRAVCRVLHAWVVPNQAAVPAAYNEFGPGKEPNPATVDRLQAVGNQVARFAALHSPEVNELMREHLCSPGNPGGHR